MEKIKSNTKITINGEIWKNDLLDCFPKTHLFYKSKYLEMHEGCQLIYRSQLIYRFKDGTGYSVLSYEGLSRLNKYCSIMQIKDMPEIISEDLPFGEPVINAFNFYSKIEALEFLKQKGIE